MFLLNKSGCVIAIVLQVQIVIAATEDTLSETATREKKFEYGCGKRSYRCGDGSCIPVSWVCDFIQDCSDNSDEDDAKCGLCAPKGFECPAHGNEPKICLPKKRLCDARMDCPLGDDELLCNPPDKNERLRSIFLALLRNHKLSTASGQKLDADSDTSQHTSESQPSRSKTIKYSALLGNKTALRIAREAVDEEEEKKKLDEMEKLAERPVISRSTLLQKQIDHVMNFDVSSIIQAKRRYRRQTLLALVQRQNALRADGVTGDSIDAAAAEIPQQDDQQTLQPIVPIDVGPAPIVPIIGQPIVAESSVNGVPEKTDFDNGAEGRKVDGPDKNSVSTGENAEGAAKLASNESK